MSAATDNRRTFGRGGTGAGWTAGQRETTRSNAKGRRAAGRLDDPSIDEAREMVEAQVCWWCGSGPWRSLVTHTRMAHGIKANDIRRLGGLIKKAPTVSVALRESMRLRPQTVNAPLDKMRAMPRKGYELSEAGRVAVLERNQRILAAQGLEQRASQLRVANAAMRAVQTKPHYCTAGCGTLIPKANPRTCSPECRKIVRQRTIEVSRAKTRRQPRT